MDLRVRNKKSRRSQATCGAHMHSKLCNKINKRVANKGTTHKKPFKKGLTESEQSKRPSIDSSYPSGGELVSFKRKKDTPQSQTQHSDGL